MSYGYDRDYVEPDEMINLKENGFEANVKIQFSPTAMEMAAGKILEEYITRNIVPKLQAKVEAFFKQSYGQESFPVIMEKIIREKFNDIYPDTVENKINEFEKQIKDLKFDDRRNGFNSESITKNATDRVNNYINTELIQLVKIEKDKLEKFSQQYFANNLFKAMGMMSKLSGDINQIENGKV